MATTNSTTHYKSRAEAEAALCSVNYRPDGTVWKKINGTITIIAEIVPRDDGTFTITTRFEPE